MKTKIHVQASAISAAQPEAIYALLVNSATYPLWSMIQYYESLQSGHAGPHDVGARRLFKTNRFTMCEEITELAPNERVGYALLSGFPLTEYHALTTLEKVESGTRIVWASSFYPKYSLTGWFWRGLMTWVLNKLVLSLAKVAESPDRRQEILGLAKDRRTMAAGGGI